MGEAAVSEAIAHILERAACVGDVPGVVAAAATKDRPIFEGGFGKRDLTTGDPMTSDTVVWIASLTKAITGACAMQLVEREKLSLDASIKEVLPELGKVRVLEGFDDKGEPKLRAPRRDITLRHLLTHTAGFGYNMWNSDIVRYMEKTGTPGTHSGMNAALTTPLLFDPGERWEYGISMDWVGKAVEATAGMRLGRYMKENVFDPLGMNDTAFRIGAAQRQRLARIHRRMPDGFVATNMEVPQEPEFEGGGGGLYSTVGDYLKFALMILHGGKLNGAQVLKPDTIALMSKNAMGDISCRPLKTATPHLTNDLDFVDGMKWGLSFLINSEKSATGRSPGSLAWAGLANSYYWIDPAQGVAGVFSTQILPFVDKKAVALFKDFETEVYRAI